MDIHPEKDIPSVIEQFEKQSRKEINVARDMPVKRKDGSVFYADINTSPIEIAGKSYLLGIFSDITERKKAEEEIHKEKAFSEAMLDSLPGIFYLFDHTGRFLRWNRAFETISGYTPEEIAAMSPLDFFTGDDRALLKESIGKVFETGAAKVEGIFLSKDGRRTPHYFVGVRFVLNGATYCIGMGIDITERKNLEGQLRHAQKMEAVGTLAGGVAHDFNNILNVIIGYGTMLMDRAGDDPLSREQIHEVLAAADRAANLTKRLLAFSRKQVVDMKPVHVAEIVLGMEKMLSRIIGEDIVFTIELADKKMIVMADTGQIEQVLMNLISNARDAMPKGGRLTISTGSEEMDDTSIAECGYGKKGTYALISVTDIGNGMDADTQKKIFEPFFTTKGIGEGTGLGLAISYGIVKKHDGFLQVFSKEGVGTTFKILLPITDEKTTKGQEVEAAIMKGGTETILIAEDDASLRKLLRIVLESFGYTVITAEDGEVAIAKYREQRDKIQLVILDMIMPKKNGKEAYEELRKISPDIKTLYLSGYTMDIITNKELLGVGMSYITKPVSPKDLLEKVRQALDR